MAESTKKSQIPPRAGGANPESEPGQQSKWVSQAQRTRSKKQREELHQRQVIIATGAALGLAVLAVIIGMIYEQLWMPSRPIAQVGDVVLTRGAYWQEQRLSYAREIAQNLQLLALFGNNAQFGGQLAGRSPGVDQQVTNIRSAPVNEQVVAEWEKAHLIEQGSTALNISVTTDEINQTLVHELGKALLPPETAPLTATETVTDSVSVTPDSTTTTPEAEETAVDVSTPTKVPTVNPGDPTMTPTMTQTPEPTPTEAPTPLVSTANEQLPKIVTELFNRYKEELKAVEQSPHLTEEDFRKALEIQYRRQLFERRIQEQLVAEETFEPTTEPERITARQILLAVETSTDATEEQRDEAFTKRKAEADKLVTQARNGSDFAELAAKHSDDPGSREQGGEVGGFDKEGLSDTGVTYDPEFVKAAFALDLNEIGDPVRTQFGWHIIQVTERIVADKADQLRAARTEAFNKWLEEQRKTAQVRRFPEPTATPEAPTTEPAPTPMPTYMPGPPTPMPTEVPMPTAETTTTPDSDTETTSETSTVTGTTTVKNTPTPTAVDAESATPSPTAVDEETTTSSPTAADAETATPSPTEPDGESATPTTGTP